MAKWLKKQFIELKETITKVPPVLMTLFVLSVIIMNLAANKSIDLSFLPGNNTAEGELGWLALDCGLLVSWMAFFTMDIVVRRFGPKASTQLTITAVGINLLTCLIFLAIGKIPGAWGESYVEVGGDLINAGLNNTIAGTWYVLMGSTIAFIASAVVHGLISSALAKLFKNKEGLKSYAVCSVAATSLGQFTDNLIFALIVSLNFFGWNILQCVMCSLTGMLVELIFSSIFVPIGHSISKRIKAKQEATASNATEVK